MVQGLVNRVLSAHCYIVRNALIDTALAAWNPVESTDSDDLAKRCSADYLCSCIGHYLDEDP